MTSLTKHHGSYFKGVALVTVMGFILILSLLMLPLAAGVFQFTSSAKVIQEDVELTEMRRSAVELVRYSLALNNTSTTATLGEWVLKLNPVSLTGTIPNLNGQPTYSFYDFKVDLTPAKNEGASNTVSVTFTGSAVVQVLGGKFPNKVYVTHIGDGGKK